MSKIILFDAVGTILKTVPGVIEVYRDHGQRHGSKLDVAEIESRFKSARQRLFNLDLSARGVVAGQLVSSDRIERELWFELIAAVFVDVKNPHPLFDELWEFFAAAKNWALFADTAAAFESLKAAGHSIGIASNFDSRLIGIVDAFPELACADFVFCSAGIGYRKPDPRFYALVEKKIQQRLGRKIDEPIWMTGDCIENDFFGPVRHGWNACWLDRCAENSSDTAEVDRIGALNELLGRVSGT